MAAVMTPDSQRRDIEVYFLAAPEDQSICEDILKHLKPIIRSSPIPIAVNSDFNIPAGMEKELHKARLLDADIVLALISADFIDNDEIYSRNQKVIERHNSRQTVMIPILVRNCLWKATPFVSLPVMPKNLQPLNNKQFWNSPDDAVMAVVSDIYDSINDLAQVQQEAIQPVPIAPVQPAPAPARQAEVTDRVQEPAPAEFVQPLSAAAAGMPAASVEMVSGEAEPELSKKELPPVAVTEVKPAPALKPTVAAPKPQATSQSMALPQIALDWREKYYGTLLLKRAGAILLDQLLILFVPIFVLGMILGIMNTNISDTALNYIIFGLYFLVMPLMESSKWQGTIGKRILKLQISDREGDRISFPRALWRNVMRTFVLYAYIVSVGALLVVQYLRFRKVKKLFHDELSGTVIGEQLTNTNTISSVASVTGHVA